MSYYLWQIMLASEALLTTNNGARADFAVQLDDVIAF